MTPRELAPADADEAVQLGRTLRARRRQVGITATAAAEAAGVSRVTWHRLEKGEPTVALGTLLEAARVLGMRVVLEDPEALPLVSGRDAGQTLPVRIRLQDFPQLRELAWQVGDDTAELTPREALGLYERNWRHIRPEALEAGELALVDALRDVFGAETLRV